LVKSEPGDLLDGPPHVVAYCNALEMKQSSGSDARTIGNLPIFADQWLATAAVDPLA